MRGRHLLAMTLLAGVACNDGTNPDRTASEKGANGGAAASGIVYGFTAAPDSQRVEIPGATVSLVLVGDFVPPPGGPDTSETPNPPLPPGPDTMLMVRGLKALADTVLSPPDTIAPPPPAACGLGVTVATVVTGSDGTWSATGLEEGVYNVVIDPPSTGSWQGIKYCDYVIRGENQERLTLYLSPAQ